MTLGFSARFHCGHTSMIRTYSLPRNSGVDVKFSGGGYAQSWDLPTTTGYRTPGTSRVYFRQLLLVAINYLVILASFSSVNSEIITYLSLIY